MENLNVRNTKLVKEVVDDEMTFTSIVLKANYRDDDGVNQDYWPTDVVKEAAYDFMINCQQGNLSHVFDTDLVKVVASSRVKVAIPVVALRVPLVSRARLVSSRYRLKSWL